MSEAKYFKITNKTEIHHGYVYNTGLNILDKPFDREGSCAPGGLYFTTIDNIHKFYHYGCHLREIFLPNDNPNFEMVEDDNKFRANMIILGDKYSLCDLETYQKFNLNPAKNTLFVEKSILSCDFNTLKIMYDSKPGKIRFEIGHWLRNIVNDDSWDLVGSELKLWLNSDLDPKCFSDVIDYISITNRIYLLNWWKNSGFRLEYSINAINKASERGHVDVLDWWKNSGLELKYDHDAINYASGNAKIDVLEWWKNSGLELKYSEFSTTRPSSKGHIDVLNWWKNSGLELKYCELAITRASIKNRVDVLNWWKDNKLDF